jgi:hypothetical protein
MELTFEEMLLAAIVRRAIRDAKEDRSDKVRYEAAAWLWDVAPVVAQRAGVDERNTAEQEVA